MYFCHYSSESVSLMMWLNTLKFVGDIAIQPGEGKTNSGNIVIPKCIMSMASHRKRSVTQILVYKSVAERVSEKEEEKIKYLSQLYIVQ